MGVAIVAVCGLLLAVGVVAIVRWGDLGVMGAPVDGHSLGDEVRRVMWWANLLAINAFASGLTVAGPGGRLIMRLVAETSGAAAQGRLTEADQRVGAITAGGTIALLVFGGIFAGVVSSLAYFMLRRFLPGGRIAGPILGLLLFVAFATRTDPLRPRNPDFALLGPDLVPVLAFAALALLQGAAVVAFAGRVSRALPALRRDPRVVVAYLPLGLVGLAGTPLIGVVAVGTFLVLASRVGPILRYWRAPATLVTGRVFLAIVAVVLTPSAVAGVRDILTAG